MPYSLLSIGNPLLDISVTGGEALLSKYELKANDAILAEDKHAPIYAEAVKDYPVTYVAGGAGQNTARGAAYVLPPKSVVYVGSVGDDDLAEQLKAANAREGLDQIYYVNKGVKTGACCVVITGHDRSLVTTLRAAEKFSVEHLKTPEVSTAIEEVKWFYFEGFFLTHGLESIEYLGTKASAGGKTVALNFSAPFIPQFFKTQLQTVLSYTDIVIMNESEAEAWGSANGLVNPKDLPAVGKDVALLPKSNSSRPRIVVITNGSGATTVVKGDKPDEPLKFAVDPLESEQIVDTNGAGDSFAGGFLGALVLGKELEEAIQVGHKLARMTVQLNGPSYKWPKEQIV
ncbi:Ribokinase-like protein [Flagelloscypha sp. PMI_526]|nr:Ribokinase-like protein [Flagelloscypha sp. PMI_526]